MSSWFFNEIILAFKFLIEKKRFHILFDMINFLSNFFLEIFGDNFKFSSNQKNYINFFMEYVVSIILSNFYHKNFSEFPKIWSIIFLLLRFFYFFSEYMLERNWNQNFSKKNWTVKINSLQSQLDVFCIISIFGFWSQNRFP